MATAGSKQGGGSCKPPPAAADQEFDPRYEWQENATSFILRIHLSGFRKQDFRVQVDGAGRLTVVGQRSDAATNPRHSRFSKVFQLPSTSNLDDIAGRFDAGVLTLTVPKRLPAKQQQVQADQAAAAAAKQQPKAPPAAAGDAKAPPPQEQDQRKAKEDEQAKKPKDEGATAGSKQGGGSCKPPPAAAADQEFDPRYEWQENATSFILRIHLSGFRKQDFRVQVDGAGRLTVRGQRSDAAANRFKKVFQLPSTSNLDDISGRFEAGVLTLTVPKRLPAKQQQVQADQAAAAAAKQQPKAPPAAAGDAKAPPPQEQDQRKGKENEQAKKPKDDAKPEDAAAASKKPAAEQVADAKRGKPEPEQQHKAAAPPAVRKEEGKPRAGAAAATPAATDDTKQAATPKPAPQADAERKAVDPESLAERVNRRGEEERAKAAAAAEERQRKACRGFNFKERVAEELQGLAGSEWAEGLVETVKKNREMIAVAVAAFSLGVFVSSKLFCRSRNGN